MSNGIWRTEEKEKDQKERETSCYKRLAASLFSGASVNSFSNPNITYLEDNMTQSKKLNPLIWGGMEKERDLKIRGDLRLTP